MDKLANLTRLVYMCCFLKFSDAKESCFLLIQIWEIWPQDSFKERSLFKLSSPYQPTIIIV
jgi:hypothetical protein